MTGLQFGQHYQRGELRDGKNAAAVEVASCDQVQCLTYRAVKKWQVVQTVYFIGDNDFQVKFIGEG